MEASNATSFSKTATCPSSSLLLSFRNNSSPQKISILIKHHLDSCDFCNAEIPLLAHYCAPHNGEPKPGEIPLNLRILAESLFAESSRRLAVKVGGNRGWKDLEERLGHFAR